MNAPGASRFHYGHVITACGFIVWFVGWGTFTPAFGIFLKPLIKDFGWSRADASLAYSVSFLVNALLGIVMGWLTDRLGPRLVMTMLGSFLGISYLALSQVQNLWHFQAAYGLLAGIGASTISIPIMVTVARWFVKDRALMMGIVQAGMGFGGLMFPPLIAWLILHYGWRSSYLVLAVIALVGLVGSGLFLRRDPLQGGTAPHGAPGSASAPGTKGLPVQSGFTLRKAIATKAFWLMTGVFCTFGFCRSAFLAHIPAHVQELGFSLTDAANIAAVVTGSSMFGRVGMGRVSELIGSRVAFALSFSLTTISLILGLLAQTLPLLYIFAFVFGFGWGNQAVLRFSVPSEIFGLASLGIVIGVLSAAESGAAMFGSYFAGYLFDVTGSYTILFRTGIAVSILGVLFAAALRPPERL